MNILPNYIGGNILKGIEVKSFREIFHGIHPRGNDAVEVFCQYIIWKCVKKRVLYGCNILLGRVLCTYKVEDLISGSGYDFI